LSAYIRARFEEFSRSQQDVAQYVVDHLDDAWLAGPLGKGSGRQRDETGRAARSVSAPTSRPWTCGRVL
jgi:hypothetical protein